MLISTLQEVCDRGSSEGVMRPLDAADLYLSIAALSFFQVSNRYAYSILFNADMTSPAAIAQRTQAVTDMVLRYVAP